MDPNYRPARLVERPLIAMLDLDAIRDRWEALEQPGAVSALRANRAAQVVSERWMEPDSRAASVTPQASAKFSTASRMPAT